LKEILTKDYMMIKVNKGLKQKEDPIAMRAHPIENGARESNHEETQSDNNMDYKTQL
jgi:hypothetical protein